MLLVPALRGMLRDMAQAADVAPMPPVSFETHPTRYRHIKLELEAPIARIVIAIQEDAGLRPGYQLKLNSYDLGVDIELADAGQRMRVEHPEISCVVITSGQEGIFSSGANIFMLGSSTHGFKVNFCKFTNETRLYIEDATENAGQTYVAALNGIASGGGYELPLACKEIYLVDDRRSAVALPEVPYLGVLPGTGGLTRVVDKRKVRRDRADIFCTLAEGIKGKRAVDWNLVDAVFPTSRFKEGVAERVAAIAGKGHPERAGVELEPLTPTITDESITYQHVTLSFGPTPRMARLELRVPDDIAPLPANARDAGSSWWALRAFRELDDAILRLRFNHPGVGVVTLATRGSIESILRLDAEMESRKDDWFVNEVRHFMKRVFKRLDYTAKSLFAILDEGSCFAGSLLELAIAADRAYMMDRPGARVALSVANFGSFPMGNGLTRLESRFLGEPGKPTELSHRRGEVMSAQQADEAGLVTAAVDPVDWADEVRLALEERASFSPDSLTGLEASLRFAGPETLETKIFGRLSAWQNWIFQRPNAVGEHGALTLYGRPESPEFDWNRT